MADVLQGHGLDVSTLATAEYQREGDDPIYLLRIPIHQALEQWDALRILVPETGYWPVIGWDRFKRPPWEEEPTQEIINKGVHLDVHEWFEREGNTYPLDRTREAHFADKPHPPFTFRIHLARFPHTPYPLVPIAMIPSDVPWKVPAYLNITGDDPPPQVHVAIMKHWYERWGAELVGLTAGSAEMRVLSPPTTHEAAFALAREQYVYCPDLVEQDTGSILVLAQLLLRSPVWWFWWD